jgi:hypothetical protein
LIQALSIQRKTRCKSCGRVQFTWEKASVSFLSQVERAKGVLGTHGDVPAGLRVVRSMTYLVPEPLNVKFESASEMI